MIWGHSPKTQRVEVTHPRSRGHHWQPGWDSRCLDLQPIACVHGTPHPSCLGYFGLPPVPAVCWHHCQEAGKTVWLKVTSVVLLALSSPFARAHEGLQSQISWVCPSCALLGACGGKVDSLCCTWHQTPFPLLGEGEHFGKVDEVHILIIPWGGSSTPAPNSGFKFGAIELLSTPLILT